MKPPSTIFNRGLLCAMFCFFFSQVFSQTTIIPYGTTWKYLDNGTNQGTAWRATGFADGAWASGPAELGYGDAPVTTVSYGPDGNNKYITTYFRKAVTITDPSSFINFTLNVRRDDGIIVYINGTERYRNNLSSPFDYLTTATNATDNGDTPQTTTLSSAFFSAGNNVIAVEIHQTSITSSDITFDLELLGNAAPVGLINFGDTWKYRDNDNRPANWETVGFNDAAWPSGASELGYGDAPATTVSYGSDDLNKYITTYFRKTFNVTSLNTYNGFTMNLVRDDGVVVYINGAEVARDNMPGGTPAHSTQASAAISGAGETTPITFNLSPCNFVEGINTIAVEMHQSDPGSSDLSFNMELIGNLGGGTPALSRGPYLQAGSETAITVRWRTSSACYGRVSVGTANGVYTTASADETCPTTEHIVRVTGLSSDTKYFYQVSAIDGTIFQGNAANFFTTLPPGNTTRKIRIAAFGDCGRGNATYQDENLANYQSYLSTNGIDAPDAWILLGDNAYNSGTDAEYSSKFFGIYESNILKNHKLYPSPGNHDYGNTSANKASRSMPYHSIFSVPQNGESGGVASGKQNYYSYDIGNIHFLSLDAYGTESDGTSIQTNGTSMLKTWLDADLAANTKKWTIAYWHHPPYTKTSHNSDTESDLIAIRQNFITYLEGKGVDLIINGHSHGYERGYMLKNFTGSWTSFLPGTHAVSTSTAFYDGSANSCPYIYNSTPANHGTVYVVAGSTGASGGTQANFDAYAFPFSVNDGGIFYFEVEDNRLDAKMLRRNGTIFDQFTIMKDIDPVNNFNQTVTVNTPVTLTSSWPGTNHAWNTTEATRSINFTPTVAGTTNFAVTDGVGCITDNFSVVASSTLPVSLLSFDAILTSANKVQVKWVTSSESNNKFFNIERSVNGRDFSIIGTVNSLGNSSSDQDYLFVDDSPLTGTSFYRLAQVDIDNRKEYFGIRRIVNNAKEFEVKTLSTMNNKLVLQISSINRVNAQLRIYDMSGREKKSEKLNLQPGIINKEFYLSTGIYIWEMRHEKGEVTFQKVIVQ